jgi:Holliday junction resolvase-like predicted endonuclease
MVLARKGDTGRLGEDIAARFLVKHGYHIVHRNWRAGKLEIDIIARGKDGLRFVEVKAGSVSRETLGGLGSQLMGYRPEWHVGPWKQRTFRNAIRIYRSSHTEDLEFHVDVIAVDVCRETHECRLQWLKDVTLEGLGD